MPQESAKNSALVLRKYFEGFTPQKRVIKKMDLKDVVECFRLPQKVGNFILSAEGNESGLHSDQVRLSLKEGLSESTLLDIGIVT